MTKGNKYVSASVLRMRKRLQENPDKALAYKEGIQNIVATGIEDFEKRLQAGEVKINNVADFERLAKLGLLLYGEPTEKVEHTTDVEEVITAEIDAIKDMDEFEAIKQKLALEMNKQNENA